MHNFDGKVQPDIDPPKHGCDYYWMVTDEHGYYQLWFHCVGCHELICADCFPDDRDSFCSSCAAKQPRVKSDDDDDDEEEIELDDE
jgi:hypothetical protein